ncbi:MAG: tubulin-like doman-containing protein [Thermoanaerobaculia bacterium]
MTEEFRSGQDTIIPTLFIGLGGVGSRIVDRIASRAARLPNWEAQLRPLTSFVSIDTNELDQHKLRNIPEGNRLNIAAFDKKKAIEGYRRSKDPQALQWLDPGYQPRPGYKPGAGQIRVEARLGFFFHSLDIRQRLKALVQECLRPGITWRQSNPRKFNVYLFCTLGGGTGSGSFLSTAYLIDAVLREQDWQPRVIANLLLSTLMLDKVGPELHPDIHANTYAALKELEHLTKLDYPEVKKSGRTSYEFVYCRDENTRSVQHVQTPPMFISFIFDRPPHLALTDAEATIADAAFLQVFTPIIDNLAGELDNYEKNQMDLTRFPGDLKNIGEGYTKNFGAYGAAALILPAHELLEYCATRFAAQAIRSQITFSVDPGNPADDRARALAKLAVDYADPKFLNMSDEDRERAINQSFVSSVQEMARQDAKQELVGGFWYRMVESADEGRQTGVGEHGVAIRGDSQGQSIERKLEEARRDLLNKVSIKERAFVFHREGVNQYVELVSRLLDEVRAARQIVDEGVRGLEAAALEGEVITDLKLDPVAERYLVLRLLDRCETAWLPDAQQQIEKARVHDVSNPKVKERLDGYFETLREAASRRSLFKGDQEFLAIRDEAQEYFRSVANAARKMFDAEIRLRQLRGLIVYLQRRSRQYARIATRMDALVQELERDAERLRRGETAMVAPLALRVEVFETLDEPRQRIWDRVYRAMFLDGGRYLSTFDRQLLAETISQELKPVVRADGTVAEKSVEQTVSDLRRSLRDLGYDRMRPSVFGQVGQPGLDLANGIELEARLVLEAGKRPGDEVTEEEIDAYRDKKFRALAQLSGVLARVSSAESAALDDGAKPNRTRQLILNLGEAGKETRFVQRLESILGVSGRQVKTDRWHDPRLAIVHDVELPIPLYYIEPITREIEEAYLHLAADERRAYNLHTDFQWEKSLPNLNPRRSEITVGWALQVLGDGLLTGVIVPDTSGTAWVWRGRDGGVFRPLGPTFATALYSLGGIHRLEDLQRRLDTDLRDARHAMTADMVGKARTKLTGWLSKRLEEISMRDLDGAISHNDILDRPIIRALKGEVSKEGELRPQAEPRSESFLDFFNEAQ